MASSESSHSTKGKVSFASLSDILSGSSNQSLKQTNRNNNVGGNVLPSLEDLQKKLHGNEESDSKLNFSRAFGLGSFNFDSFKHQEQQPAVDQTSSSQKLDNSISKAKSGRQTRSKENKINISVNKQTTNETRLNKSELKTTDDDSNEDIIQIINQIEKHKASMQLNEDFKDSKQIKELALSEFNLIQLPNDFKLDHGHVNVYQSGIIEIVSGDVQPVIYRMQRAKHPNKNQIIKTDLVIATDCQVYVDQMNIFVPTTL